ncbi:bifunctional pyr operon transcriptional regulator/uracil phosphoribosyltransferase PyrR, partial [Myxococcota bacterium]|nr:bifunctional pyr operon transcriptional regulator/uracil phosphoribosyltransferase PyrR [Myxococcota bacterium]
PPRPSPEQGKEPGARGVGAGPPAEASEPRVNRSRLEETGRVVLDDARIHRALMRIAHEIVESSADGQELYLVAIPNGGVPLGRALAANLADLLGIEVPMGILDTTLYRDDLGTRGTRPRLRRTEMPSSVDERVVILVEDVVNTGCTIRAAMDALMDFGRPRAVKVVSLVDRGHRELPIKIDFVGKNIPTRPGETVRLRVGDGAKSEAAGADGAAAASDQWAPMQVVVLSENDSQGVEAADRWGGEK